MSTRSRRERGGRPVRPVREIAGYLRPHRRRLLLGVLAFIVKDCPIWAMPLIVGATVDLVARGDEPVKLVPLVCIAVVVIAQNVPFHVLWTWLFNGSVRQAAASMRNAIAARLQELSIGYFARTSNAVIQTKLVRDVENIELMLQQSVPPALSSMFTLTFALIATALLVPQFIAVYALTLPLAIVLYAAVRVRVNRRNEEFRREVEVFSARVSEMATLMPVTRAHGVESAAFARVADAAANVRDRGITLDLLNGRFGSSAWVAMQLLNFLTLASAAYLALSGVLPISAGEVVILGTYFTALTAGMTQILMLLPVTSKGLESARSIAEVMRDPDRERNEGKRPVSSVTGALRFERVGFRYARDLEQAVSDVDIDIRAGEMVAFVGPSGSGKSTVVNLALGFLRPTSGRLLIDGVDMEQLDLRSYRTHLSVVPQESILFEGSVRDNVVYGLGPVCDARVRDALEAANALEFVDAMPQGWDTVVGERGARLSGGQRQRLAIARALIRDPRVLLLDEATSALDSEAEAKVREALDRLVHGRTTLVVAHRLSTIRRADRIIVLRDGRIAEAGSHAELLAADGAYARMTRLQSDLND